MNHSPTIALKVASVSMNQTIENFTRNMPNILKAIDMAVADGADVLSLQELGLTGYSGDDYFKWIRTDQQQKEVLELVQHIADYANERNPNLIISLGFPFFYADKSQPVKLNLGSEENPIKVDNPLYNINNRPFNAQALISGGSIQSISAKSILPDGPAEYEARQFLNWPDYLGVRDITLCTGQKVKFGNVLNQIGAGDTHLTLYHEICAEGWRGIYDDGSIHTKEMMEGRHLVDVARNHDVSLTLNPSASKPEPFLDKPSLRANLCNTGSAITGGAYIYTNSTGLEAAPAAFEGGSIYSQNGALVHRGERYSMADVTYSSAVLQLPAAQKGKANAVIAHDFTDHKPELVKGGSAAWEYLSGDARIAEEVIRNTALWLRDYLNKTGQQGYFISLSGGQDSAFGAVMISQMIDLNIAQLHTSLGDKQMAVTAFIDQFDELDYARQAHQINQLKGADAAIDFIKSKMLTCAYMPSENSSKATEDAARFLIEGGTTVDVVDDEGIKKTLLFDNAKDRLNGNRFTKWLNDDRSVEYEVLAVHENQRGIGGTFHVVEVQSIIDTYMEAFAGADYSNVTPELKAKAQSELKAFIAGDLDELSDDVAPLMKRRVPSWRNKTDDILLQNIQARARSPMAWLFGNDERKIACVTSNWSEAVAGYWTFGGDGHMGSLNILGGIPKSDLRNIILSRLQHQGIAGLAPVEGLAVVNGNKASAELRKLKDGEVAQFDEDDMMPYEQLDAVARSIIIDKNSPSAAYHILRQSGKTFPDGSPLFSSDQELIVCIEKCCKGWDASQFKRVASVIAPFLGQNVDPHTAVRTTIMSDLFKTGRAALKLEYLKDQLGGEAAFQAHTGHTYHDMQRDAKCSRGLRSAILSSSISTLKDDIVKPDFIIKTDLSPWAIGA